MTGTFDVQNFGDLLFPLLARHELERRLGRVEVQPYSYREMSAASWPYEVRSLGRLAGDIASFDLLLIGGGGTIRGDAGIIPPEVTTSEGYHPDSPEVHEPLGLWLVPMLHAAANGVPIAWNAVGVRPTLEEWSAPLIQAACSAACHLAVREPRSAENLLAVAPDAEPVVVPDTAFGVDALLGDDEVTDGGRDLAGMNGRPYLVVQPSRLLGGPFREPVRAAVDAARERDLAIVEVPIGPAVGDAAGRLELSGTVTTVSDWRDPLALASMLGSAQAVIADSLHAGIVAVSSGVPLFRPAATAEPKHMVLEGLAGVGTLESATEPEGFAPAPPDPALAEFRARIGAHWDAVAQAAQSAQAAVRRPAPSVMSLLNELPTRLAEAAELQRQRAEEIERAAELEAAYEAFRERTRELSRELRRSQRGAAALRAAADQAHAELETLRSQEAGLRLVETTTWWRLRLRLDPLFRVYHAVRAFLARRRSG